MGRLSLAVVDARLVAAALLPGLTETGIGPPAPSKVGNWMVDDMPSFLPRYSKIGKRSRVVFPSSVNHGATQRHFAHFVHTLVTLLSTPKACFCLTPSCLPTSPSQRDAGTGALLSLSCRLWCTRARFPAYLTVPDLPSCAYPCSIRPFFAHSYRETAGNLQAGFRPGLKIPFPGFPLTVARPPLS